MSNKAFYSILAILAILNLFIFDQRIAFPANDKLEITILDIGQGDSILIKTPENSYGLIDTGKGSAILEELANTTPFFTKTFDFVILTHPDADHIEGFLSILDKYEFKNVFFNKIDKESSLYDEVTLRLKYTNSHIYSIEELNDFEINNVVFDILWPKSLDLSEFEVDPNESSVALKISYKNFSIYSAGDLGEINEIKSVENLEDRSIDILKVSHHGSKTSTSTQFLDFIDEKAAIISLGKDNSYGHPDSSTIKELEAFNQNIYRTDLNGRIKISTDGDSIELKPEIGEALQLSAD